MADRVQFRRDTLANWDKFNPVLLDGEIGLIMDDGKDGQYKMGKGAKHWKELPFAGFDGSLHQTTGDDTKGPMSQKATSDIIELTLEVSSQSVAELAAEVSALKKLLYSVISGEHLMDTILISGLKLNGAKYLLTGEVTPTDKPDFIGQLYIDTMEKICYIAVGVSSVLDWKAINTK